MSPLRAARRDPEPCPPSRLHPDERPHYWCQLSDQELEQLRKGVVPPSVVHYAAVLLKWKASA